jgi:hypothetical protein
MHTTRISRLVVIALVVMAIGFALTQIVMGQSSRSLPVPAMAAGALWILGGGFGIWTYLAKPRLKREPGTKPFPPLAAARIAVLALAGSRTGAVIAGFYAGVALASMGNIDTPAGWSATINGFLAALGGILLVISSLWLESLCVARDQGTTPDK